ncbi:MAG: penicillin-binding protein 2 [Candidatus Moranbacteria bacterium]|nr:penicillin-binding protein 2 [Candidatus Moranbacteria bacterium]
MILNKFFKNRRQGKGIEIEEVTNFGDGSQREEMLISEPIDSWGFRFFRLVAILVFAALAVRVFYLQVLKGDFYNQLAKDNRMRYVDIKAPRGIIFDRNGRELVRNVPSFDAIFIPADFSKDAAQKNNEIKSVAEILGMNDQNVAAITNSQDADSLNPVLVKSNISEEEALVFSEKKSELEGFYLDRTAVRQYENGAVFSPVVGYTGKINPGELKDHSDYLLTDYIGKMGLEESYEKYLRGVNGKQKVEVDSSGNIKKNLGTENPINGSDLHLGLDADLQEKIEERLENMFSQTGTKTAAAVAINPKNGEILALVSLPGFDNNLFSQGISSEDYGKLLGDENKPMFNRAISGEYPPGSTLKPLVAAAALQEKTISPDTTVDCGGGIRIGSYNFPDWKTHGLTDVRKAIAESCDVFFYTVGGGWQDVPALGIDRIKKYADLFGLGKILGIDIPGETSGLMPDQSWKLNKIGERWYQGDDFHSAIGQGFDTVTPLQLANYIAAIANGGTVYRPHFASYVKKNDGTEEKINPEVLNKNFISPSNISVVREGMRQTVVSGTAQSLKDLPVEAAGKTGTAQFGSENKTHGWFVSFAPYDDPEIAMAVLVEGGGEGHSTAVPVTKEVLDWYFGERKK